MQVWPIPPDPTGILTLGVPTRVTTTVDGQGASLTFTGTAGQDLLFDFADNSFFATVVLRAPNGDSLLRDVVLFEKHSTARVPLAAARGDVPGPARHHPGWDRQRDDDDVGRAAGQHRHDRDRRRC